MLISDLHILAKEPTLPSIGTTLHHGNMLSLGDCVIGVAKTSTYYALAPFVGALLSILLLGEPVTMTFVVASLVMAVGCWLAT